jgi:very-short-patch-repair endonuclease
MAEEVEFARHLRRSQTDAEQRLWSRLRNRGVGVKFKRQVSILGYFADFLSEEVMLIVEVDGSQHAHERLEHDLIRTHHLEAEGFTVMRLWNRDVLLRTDHVVASIGLVVEDLTRRQAPHPTSKMSTSPEGEVAPVAAAVRSIESHL